MYYTVADTNHQICERANSYVAIRSNFVEKCCPMCGKYFIDHSPNYSTIACSVQCRNEWYNYSDPKRYFHRKISLRLNFLAGQGVQVTSEERQVIEEKIIAGKCEICGGEFPMDKLDIDHDHKTNKIRGVLCSHCNIALGNVQDDPKILEKMVEYLRDNC